MIVCRRNGTGCEVVGNNIQERPEDRKSPEEIEAEAYRYGLEMAAEYAHEIGQTDLSLMSAVEIFTLAECMCKSYHMKLIELTKK